jgi:hypothetical protein
MALQKDVVIKQNGFEGFLICRGAYWKIDRIVGNKNGIHIEIQCLVNNVAYKQEDHYFVPTLDGKNFIAQAYDYLKTLPEFAEAIDC